MVEVNRQASIRFLRWVWLLIVIGVMFRMLRYGIRMPIWGDEAMLGVNFLDRSLGNLFAPLEFGQVLPAGYLAISWVLMQMLGYSELVVRLLATTSSVVTLFVLYWFVSRRFDLAKTVCITAMLAVSYYTVRHGAEFKPYATDALVALLLLVSTVQVYSDDSSKKWWGAFFILIPSAPLFSFPSVFVSAACLCTLIVAAIVGRDRARLQLGMSTTAISLAVFTAYYLGYIASHAEANSVLFSYWQDSFAPTNLLEFPMWLVQQLTGRMLAYPIGGDNFGSLLTFLFCVLGIWSLVKIGEYFLVCLLVLPFGFNLIAAVMHLYPFGGSTRIAQHLAPSIVILGGVGLAWMISRGNPGTKLKRGHVITFSIMVLLGLAGIAQTLIKPYKSKGALQVRRVVEELVESSRCAPVYVINDKNQVPINFRWYLGIDERAVWKADDELLGRQSGNVCVMSFDADLYPEQREILKRILSLPSAKRIEHERSIAYLYRGEEHPHHYHIVRLKLSP